MCTDANRQASQPTDHRSDAISPQHHQVVANRNYQQQQQPQHASHSNNLHHHHQQQMHSDDAMMNKVRSDVSAYAKFPLDLYVAQNRLKARSPTRFQPSYKHVAQKSVPKLV